MVTCFARSQESREAFATAHGCAAAGSIDETLADDGVDALLVATPHTTHLDLVRRASEAGKHLFVEKPLALSVAEAQACVDAADAADAAGVTLLVGHHRRRSAANRRLKTLVDEGALGMIHLAEATIHVPKYQNPPDGWRGNPAESPAGATTGLGVHMVDTMQYLLGPITRVSAYSKRILGRWDVDDATTVMFEFESGPLGTLTTSLVLPRICDLGLYGHQQSAWSRDDGTRLIVQPVGEPVGRDEPLKRIDELVEQLTELARCARGDERPETDGPAAVTSSPSSRRSLSRSAPGRPSTWRPTGPTDPGCAGPRVDRRTQASPTHYPQPMEIHTFPLSDRVTGRQADQEHPEMTKTVGVVGLGTMGGAMAHYLVKAGFDVVGTDVSTAMRERLEQDGGRTVDSAADVAAAADVIVTSLPSAVALDEVVSGAGGLATTGRAGTIVLETSTLPLDVKEQNRAALEAAGVIMLDCPLSGTGGQAWKKDLVVFISGDDAASSAVVPVVEGFSRAHFILGEFGAGSKMKYLANLLVTIHNVAAAEAITLGIKAGLEPARILEVLTSGAGTSRMLEVRGPAMVANDYSNAGMAAQTYLKDVKIIGDFAKSLQCPVPLFNLSGEVHVSAVAQGHGRHDTSSVCAVVSRAAGVVRPEPSAR